MYQSKNQPRNIHKALIRPDVHLGRWGQRPQILNLKGAQQRLGRITAFYGGLLTEVGKNVFFIEGPKWFKNG